MASSKTLVFTILGIDKASDTFDKIGDSIDRMGGRSAKILAGIVGASVASAAGTAAALGGVPALFIGIGAAAASQTEVVRDAFGSLSESLRSGIIEDAGPLEDAFVSAAGEIGDAYNELRPQLQAAFAASVPHVAELTRGVTGFARTAMPGMLTAVRSAEPIFEGLSSLLVSTGLGLSDFLETVAVGAPAAGAGLDHLGTIIEGVLPNAGRLLVSLSGLWAEHGDQVARVVTKIADAATDLGTNALPVASSALGVALDMLEGVLNIIGPLADQLGPLIGLWISLSLAMRLMGTAQSAISNITGHVSNFRTEMAKAGSPAGVGRLTTAVGGIMGMMGGPWGLALAGAGVALALFGNRSQDAAQAQRSLAGALRESGGAFDTNAAAALANSDQYKDVSKSVEKTGLSHKRFIGALAEGGPELDKVTERLRAQASETELVGAGTAGASYQMTEKARAAQHLLSSLDGLRGTVVGATEEFNREQAAIGGASSELTKAVPGVASLREAMKTLGQDTADTADKVDALNTAWRHLFGITLTLDEAVAGFEEGLDQIREQVTGLQKETRGWRGELFQADGQINLTTEAGRELHGNLVTQGEAYRELAQTSYDTALRQGMSQQQAAAVAVQASEVRRAQFIKEMADVGITGQAVQVLANKYFGLPKNIITLIQGDTGPAQGAVDKFIRDNNGRIIHIKIQTSGNIQAYNSAGRPIGMAAKAEGGPVEAFHMYRVNERGEELFVPGADGSILPAQHTSRILAAIRNNATGSVARMGGGGRTGGLGGLGPVPSRSDAVTVRLVVDGADSDLLRLVRRMVRVEGHGDVQTAFGRG